MLYYILVSVIKSITITHDFPSVNYTDALGVAKPSRNGKFVQEFYDMKKVILKPLSNARIAIASETKNNIILLFLCVYYTGLY